MRGMRDELDILKARVSHIEHAGRGNNIRDTNIWNLCQEVRSYSARIEHLENQVEAVFSILDELYEVTS